MANLNISVQSGNSISVGVEDGNNLNVDVQGGNNINVEVTPTPRQTITLDRGVAGNGVESVSIVYVAPNYFLEFDYTNGSSQLVQLPSIVTGVSLFNGRAGSVVLLSSDVTSALGYTPPTPTGTGASGTWAISVSGNAATATNVPYSGLTGIVPTWNQSTTGNAATVTNGVYTTDIGTVTNTMLAGFIANGKLSNSTITINGTPVSLGGSISISSGVGSVGGTLPIVSSGGATPVISITQANTSSDGYLSSTDWNTFNNKTSNLGTVTSVAAIAGTGIQITGSPITTSGTFNITNSAPDQTVVITAGTGISVSGTYPNFTITNTASGGGTVTAVTGVAPVVSSGGATPAISMAAASTSVNGYLTSTDWNTFNNKTSNTGTVTSVAATAGTGISITGSPITTTGTFNIVNTAPDQVVSLTQGGTTTITGTYPNFTISSADQFAGTVTSVGGTGTVNGITLTGTVTTAGSLTLGGTLSNVSLSTQVTGTLPILNGGTGQTTQTAAFDALAPTTTKGDLIVSNGTDNVRLPVGTDTYSLIADSTQATGVRWSASASAGVSQIIAGTNITISPVGGTGAVTINSSGGGGGGASGFEQTFLLMGA